MLRSLYIESLFDIYTYDIDLTENGRSGLKFITSPNGYGKTTILNIIDAFYSLNWDYYLHLPFHCIRFTFDKLKVNINKTEDLSQEDNSDEVEHKTRMELHVTDLDDKLIVGWENDDINMKEDENESEFSSLNPLQLYSNSQSCYYIHDNRLRKVNVSRLSEGSPSSNIEVVADAEELKNKLVSVRKSIMEMAADLSFGQPISREAYQEADNELKPFLEILERYGLIKKDMLTEYQENNAVYLGAIVHVLQQIKERFSPFTQKLALFEDIINRSDFSYKEFQIHLNHGFRFISQNKKRTILQLETLSSGEQHILILMYEMLFAASEDSLVLLDEPELSFHFAWQSDFLSFLRGIQKLRPSLQWIICTHSPLIFGRDWTLSTDLFQLQQQGQSVQR